MIATEAPASIRRKSWRDAPAPVRRRVELLALDFTAVSLAGRAAPVSGLVADHASAVFGGDEATALVDGRRLSAPGAAWANGVLGNALDFDDGHRQAKGHAGACVIPAALAAAELTDASREDLLAAVLAGYETALDAAVAQHAREPRYHASGSWGALGAAAAAGLLLELDDEALRTALGIAAYHGPIAPIERSVAQPSMNKDAVGWGAFTGISAALLAARGFTSLAAPASAEDAGWRVCECYLKPHPSCRWGHPAIAAALELRGRPGFSSAEIARVRVRAFEAALGLGRALPETTEDAQYSLVWPTAVALVSGRFGVDEALGGFDDPEAGRLAAGMVLEVDARYEAAFPERRLSEVILELRTGEELRSGPHEARGEPDDPDWEAIVLEKAGALIPPVEKLPPGVASLLRRLVDLPGGPRA